MFHPGVVLKATGDATAIGVVGATLLHLLPPLAAAISILYTAVSLYFLIKDRNKHDNNSSR